MKDIRYLSIYNRLSQLTSQEIQRIIDNIDICCFDEFNYDENTKTYCPLALALNLHNTLSHPSNNKIIDELSINFNPVNILKNLPGEFYHDIDKTKRKKDLLEICQKILSNK